jgi:hypothetical protein
MVGDKLCFHRTNSRDRWPLVIHGVKKIQSDPRVFMSKAPLLGTKTSLESC